MLEGVWRAPLCATPMMDIVRSSGVSSDCLSFGFDDLRCWLPL